MDGHDGADAVVEGVGFKQRVQEHRRHARLPVVAVNDVRMEINHRQDGQRSLGEEAELLDIPVDISIGLFPVEIVLVVNEIVGHAIQFVGHDPHVNIAELPEIHIKMMDVAELAAIFVRDAPVVGQHNAHIVLAAVKRLGKRANHVGQSAGFDKRNAFRSDKQNVFHFNPPCFCESAFAGAGGPETAPHKFLILVYHIF